MKKPARIFVATSGILWNTNKAQDCKEEYIRRAVVERLLRRANDHIALPIDENVFQEAVKIADSELNEKGE